jgi:hypothetical protein
MPPRRNVKESDKHAPADPAPRTRTTRSQSAIRSKDEGNCDGRKTRAGKNDAARQSEKPRETRQAARRKAAETGPVSAASLPQQKTRARRSATQPATRQGGSVSDTEDAGGPLSNVASDLPGSVAFIYSNFPANAVAI